MNGENMRRRRNTRNSEDFVVIGAPALAHSQRPTGDFTSFYYFVIAIVVIRHETKAAARRALTFVVRIFVNDTIAITVWTRFYFHVAARASGSDPTCSCSPLVGMAGGFHLPDCLVRDIGCLHALLNKPPCSLRQCNLRLTWPLSLAREP